MFVVYLNIVADVVSIGHGNLTQDINRTLTRVWSLKTQTHLASMHDNPDQWSYFTVNTHSSLICSNLQLTFENSLS